MGKFKQVALNVYQATYSGEHRYPKDIMNSLGFKVLLSVPNIALDSVEFVVEDYVDEMPDYIHKLEREEPETLEELALELLDEYEIARKIIAVHLNHGEDDELYPDIVKYRDKIKVLCKKGNCENETAPDYIPIEKWTK